MPAAAEPVPGMPEEFTGPVAYDDRWLWIAAVLLALVVAWYLLSWWLTRPPRPTPLSRTGVDVPDAQRAHLARIDDLAGRVHRGELPAREGHQQLSELVRSYVATVTTLPARTMALADFRHRAPQELVDTIEVMYPPEFAPDDDLAMATFNEAVDRARDLVGTWG